MDWDIRRELKRMGRQIERLFSEGTSRFKEGFSSNFRRPLSEFEESEDEYVASIELPGIDKNDIKLDIGDENIEIKAEKRHEMKSKDEEKGEYRYAKKYVGFRELIDIPRNVDRDNIDAEYKNGMLIIKMRKLKSKKKSLKIK